MTTHHTIPTTPKTDPFRDDPGHLDSTAIILVEGSNNRAGHGLCAWTEDGQGRLVFQGPKVKGPHASLFGLCGVIDNHGGTGAENKRAEREGRLFRVKSGDVLEVCGVAYSLSLCPRGYPKLRPIIDASDELSGL